MMQSLGHPSHAFHAEFQVVHPGWTGGDTEGGLSFSEDGILSELPGKEREGLLNGRVLELKMEGFGILGLR
jgi:hypothetical protein